MTETLWCLTHHSKSLGYGCEAAVGMMEQGSYDCRSVPMLLIPKDAPSITLTPTPEPLKSVLGIGEEKPAGVYYFGGNDE